MRVVLLILGVVVLVTAKPSPEANPVAKPQYDLPLDHSLTSQIQSPWDISTFPRSGCGGGCATGYMGCNSPCYGGQQSWYGGQVPWYGVQVPWYGGQQPESIGGTQSEWNKKTIQKSIQQLQKMLDDIEKEANSDENVKTITKTIKD